jgi:Domain of unknown function (DUF5666)
MKLLTSLRALALALLAAVAACGGGVETGGTGPTGSSYVEGPITGFGSIIVGGVRFDERSATVVDAEDRTIGRGELRLGMVVSVEGSRPIDDGSGGRNALAARVRLGGPLLGPLQAIDTAQSRLVVLGQTVRIAPATVFGGVPGGLAGLAVGDVLEVHGFPTPPGLPADLVATRVERRAAPPAAYRVRGVARELNPNGAPPTLRIGSETFDLAATGVPAGLVNGELVRLELGTAPVSGRWPVTRVTVETRRLDDRDEAEVEGLVTAFTSATSFAVNGIPVNASGAAFPDGTAGLTLGARVEVEGRVVGGVLVASEVDLRSDDEETNEGVDLRGTLSQLDRAARTFVLRGIAIFYGGVPPPEYDDGNEATLADGRCVRVRATLDLDRTRVVARRIEFESDCN